MPHIDCDTSVFVESPSSSFTLLWLLSQHDYLSLNDEVTPPTRVKQWNGVPDLRNYAVLTGLWLTGESLQQGKGAINAPQCKCNTLSLVHVVTHVVGMCTQVSLTFSGEKQSVGVCVVMFFMVSVLGKKIEWRVCLCYLFTPTDDTSLFFLSFLLFKHTQIFRTRSVSNKAESRTGNCLTLCAF